MDFSPSPFPGRDITYKLDIHYERYRDLWASVRISALRFLGSDFIFGRSLYPPAGPSPPPPTRIHYRPAGILQLVIYEPGDRLGRCLTTSHRAGEGQMTKYIGMATSMIVGVSLDGYYGGMFLTVIWFVFYGLFIGD